MADETMEPASGVVLHTGAAMRDVLLAVSERVECGIVALHAVLMADDSVYLTEVAAESAMPLATVYLSATDMANLRRQYDEYRSARGSVPPFVPREQRH